MPPADFFEKKALGFSSNVNLRYFVGFKINLFFSSWFLQNPTPCKNQWKLWLKMKMSPLPTMPKKDIVFLPSPEMFSGVGPHLGKPPFCLVL